MVAQEEELVETRQDLELFEKVKRRRGEMCFKCLADRREEKFVFSHVTSKCGFSKNDWHPPCGNCKHSLPNHWTWECVKKQDEFEHVKVSFEAEKKNVVSLKTEKGIAFLDEETMLCTKRI
jgi:hypothetical protein